MKDKMILVLGIALVIIGIGLIALSLLSRAEVRGGGIVIIGPLPIVFGTDEQMIFYTVILAVILIALFIIIFHLIRS